MIVRIFVSYSHADEGITRELLDHLKGLKDEGIDLWFDRSIATGSRWDDTIRQEIRTAQIALVLVSQAYLDSAYCQNVEIPLFLEQQERAGLVILPVMLSPCEWTRHPWLAHRQFFPPTGSVEVDYADSGRRKLAFHEIRQQLRGHVERLRQARAAPIVNWRRIALILPLIAGLVLAGDWRQGTALSTLEVGWDRFAHRVVTAARDNVGTRVVALDLSAFAGGSHAVTSRPALRKILEDLSRMQPLGIGVAVNFTPPRPGVYQDMLADPAFFAFCRELAKTSGIPIHLGVYGTEALPAAYWLGDAEYSDLASSIAIPVKDTSRLPRRLTGASGDGLVSMSYALALDYLRVFRPSHSWLSRLFLDHRAIRDRPEFAAEEFRVDASLLPELQRGSLPIAAEGRLSGAAWEARIRNRLVLIGASQPLATGGPPNDVFVHAAGAETLVRGPLLEPRLAVRLLAAVIIAAVLLILDDIMKNRRQRRGVGVISPGRSAVVAVWVLAGLWLLSVALAAWFRIVWFDVPIIAAALAGILLWRHASARRYRAVSATLVVAVLSASVVTRAQTQNSGAVGWVTPVKGTTFLLKTGEKKETPLRPGSGARTPVSPGDRVWCEAGGVLTLTLDGKDIQPDCSVRYPIPVGVSGEQSAIRAAFQEYARLGGVSRADDALLLWPTNKSRTTAERIRFRWTPVKGPIVLSIVHVSTGATLWHQSRIDGSTGELVPQGARDILRKLSQNQADLELQVVLAGSSGTSTTTIELLSPVEEKRLAADLEQWATYDDPVLRAIGRAFTYGQFRMYEEVADSYGEALKQEPDSVPLLKKAMESYKQIGAESRVRELTNHLEKLGQLPSPKVVEWVSRH